MSGRKKIDDDQAEELVEVEERDYDTAQREQRGHHQPDELDQGEPEEPEEPEK